MDIPTIRRFRENIRHIERELNIQNNSNCCHGITLAQCHTLLELFLHESINLSELSERLYLDKSTVSRTIEGLVKNGLVNRTIPTENRRKVIISLTQKGIDICTQINSDNDSYFGTIIDSIPPKDLPIFLKSFETIVNEMIQNNRINNKPC
ncbi:MarR family winged helix-turn-helix transcriptional regulator [Bacteroidota bacterium]